MREKKEFVLAGLKSVLSRGRRRHILFILEAADVGMG